MPRLNVGPASPPLQHRIWAFACPPFTSEAPKHSLGLTPTPPLPRFYVNVTPKKSVPRNHHLPISSSIQLTHRHTLSLPQQATQITPLSTLRPPSSYPLPAPYSQNFIPMRFPSYPYTCPSKSSSSPTLIPTSLPPAQLFLP